MTRESPLRRRTVTLLENLLIVVGQFLARGDVPDGLDPDAPAVDHRIAIRIARVVDPARGIAAVLGVDHPPFVDVEIKGMVRVLGIVRMAALGFLPGDHFAHVFNDAFALGDVLQRENALAVDAGAPDLEAVLPAQMCGAAALKFSFGGASFGAAAGQIPAFYDEFIGATGKSLADVSFASASSTGSGDCPDISAFKVSGLDQNALQGFYTASQTSDGNDPVPASIAGKNVIKTNDGNYAYFKGDTVFVVDAGSDEQAAIGLQMLP